MTMASFIDTTIGDKSMISMSLHSTESTRVDMNDTQLVNLPYEDKSDVTTNAAAKGTASLGRASEPPPSEKSSTLDAKDSKLNTEEAQSYKYSPCYSEVASSSSALLVPGHDGIMVRSKRRISPASKVQFPNLNDSRAIPPPLPSRKPWPPLPPKTYNREIPPTVAHPTPFPEHVIPPPLPDRTGPPLPPRNYLQEFENKEADPLSIPAEELFTPDSLVYYSQEESENRNNIPLAKPITTVLLANSSKQMINNPPPYQVALIVDAECSTCDGMKKLFEWYIRDSNYNGQSNNEKMRMRSTSC